MTHLYFLCLMSSRWRRAAGNSGLIPKGNYVLDQSDGLFRFSRVVGSAVATASSQLYAGLLARTLIGGDEELMRTFRQGRRRTL